VLVVVEPLRTPKFCAVPSEICAATGLETRSSTAQSETKPELYLL
jgi:hypothetical protein